MTKKKTSDDEQKGGKSLLEHISPGEAFDILRDLCEKDARVRKKIERLHVEQLKDVDVDGTADSVFWDLNCLEVEDLWDRSGKTRHGYNDPIDVAYEMFKEAIRPHIDELERYRELSMHDEAMVQCMGIIKGIAQYEEDSGSQFLEWAQDIPREYSAVVLDRWKRGKPKKKLMNEMDRFIKEHMPDWDL